PRGGRRGLEEPPGRLRRAGGRYRRRALDAARSRGGRAGRRTNADAGWPSRTLSCPHRRIQGASADCARRQGLPISHRETRLRLGAERRQERGRPMTWDHETDFLVVGSGGGGMAAAILAHDQGARTLVVEKGRKFGGSTGMSGGALWVPLNDHLV